MWAKLSVQKRSWLQERHLIEVNQEALFQVKDVEASAENSQRFTAGNFFLIKRLFSSGG